MIDIHDAYNIAVAEVHIPIDAILTYSNLLANKFVFEWKHAKEDAYSETDRILIWIDPISSNLLKKDVEWSTLKQPIFTKSNLQSVATIGIELQEYRKIGKDAYFTYSGEPLQDYYWIGKSYDAYETTCYLIDDYGNIVGQMIPMPTENGCSFSGYMYSNPDQNCWNTVFYQDYFDNWTNGYIETGCGISEETYRNRVSDPSTLFYQCTAHGVSAGFRIKSDFYVSVAYINEIMENRPPIPFAHLDHCEAMRSTDQNSISYAYRKGSNINTVVFGLKYTTDESWYNYLVNWRACFYDAVSAHKSTPINQIFHDCIATYPVMDGHMDIKGDTLLTLNDIICVTPNCDFGVIA